MKRLRTRLLALLLVLSCACAAALPYIATAITSAQQVQEWAMVIADAVPGRVPADKQEGVLAKITQLVATAKVLEKAGEAGESLSREEYAELMPKLNSLYTAVVEAVAAYRITPDEHVSPGAFAHASSRLSAHPGAPLRVPMPDDLVPLDGVQ